MKVAPLVAMATLFLSACSEAPTGNASPSSVAAISVGVANGAARHPSGTAGSPELDYALNCQGCHQFDGSGMGDRVPAMKGFVANFLSVPGGREYLTRVPGVTGAALDDEALAKVMNYVLRSQDPGNLPADFVEFSTEEMAAGRKNVLGSDAPRVRAELLDRLSETADRKP